MTNDIADGAADGAADTVVKSKTVQQRLVEMFNEGGDAAVYTHTGEPADIECDGERFMPVTAPLEVRGRELKRKRQLGTYWYANRRRSVRRRDSIVAAFYDEDDDTTSVMFGVMVPVEKWERIAGRVGATV